MTGPSPSTTPGSTLQIRRLSYSLGAEITGVDIGDVDAEAFGRIHRGFLEHGVIVFRDQQRLTREQHIAFGRRFGELDRHDSLPRDHHPVRDANITVE